MQQLFGYILLESTSYISTQLINPCIITRVYKKLLYTGTDGNMAIYIYACKLAYVVLRLG